MDSKELIIKTLKDKSCLKQNVYAKTFKAFEMLKEVLEETMKEIEGDFGDTDSRVTFNYASKSKHEAEVKIAGDQLIFNMHSNVFQFEPSNSVWQTSYLKEDDRNGYVGVINVYNFLADSIKYQRMNDSGYLVARIFINRENHFMVQGKRQLGYLYNDFINAVINRETLKELVHSALLYTMDFDLLIPPYDAVQEVSVGEMQMKNHEMRIKTAKRLGFKFSFDQE